MQELAVSAVEQTALVAYLQQQRARLTRDGLILEGVVRKVRADCKPVLGKLEVECIMRAWLTDGATGNCVLDGVLRRLWIMRC